jgi:hypothetical protein
VGRGVAAALSAAGATVIAAGVFDLSNSDRVVAALAREYGFVAVDGGPQRPLDGSEF